MYSTYLAGSMLNAAAPCAGCFPDSEIWGVATDASGNAYVTGYTTTMDFPVTSGAFATTSPATALSDIGFVSKFTASGAIAYSTYLGGQNFSLLDAIAVDASGSAYVTGSDSAGDGFPIVTIGLSRIVRGIRAQDGPRSARHLLVRTVTALWGPDRHRSSNRHSSWKD